MVFTTHLQCHPVLDQWVVLVSVEHQNGIGEDVHRIWVGKHPAKAVLVTFLRVSGKGRRRGGEELGGGEKNKVKMRV